MKLLALLSTGIDSPVACYLMLKRGFDVEYLHFSSQNRSLKVKEIVKLLTRFGGISRFFQVSHSEMMNEIFKLEFDRKYTCVMCKRGMLSFAEVFSKKIGCDALLTGDNLGQVASQTIPNLRVEEEQIEIPVLRPLIAFDKEDIVEIARKIGSYAISIEKEPKCKYTPKKPATAAKNLPKLDVSNLSRLKVEELEV